MALEESKDGEVSLVNVQCPLDPDYYNRLVARANANDRSARREAIRIIKAVLDGNIQFVDPEPVAAPGSVVVSAGAEGSGV